MQHIYFQDDPMILFHGCEGGATVGCCDEGSSEVGALDGLPVNLNSESSNVPPVPILTLLFHKTIINHITTSTGKVSFEIL